MEHVTGTVIAETTVQQVTIDDILKAETVEQIENFNIDINERLDNTKFCIQQGEGGFTLEDQYDFKQWDPDYGDNDPIS